MGGPRLRVLLLTTAMTAGGSQRYLATLMEHLDREHFEPELAMKDPGMEFEIPDDVPVWLLEDCARIEPPVVIEFPAGVAERATYLGLVQSTVDRIANLVWERQPDIVLCCPEWMSAPAAAAAHRFPHKTRLVCRFGAPGSLAFPDDGTTLYSMLARRYVKDTDTAMAVSEAIAEDLVEHFGVPRERIVVRHNPIDVARAQTMSAEPVDEIDFEDEIPTVLFVGRIVRVKGLEYLLRAIARIAETMTVRCVLVGAGGQRGYLEALAKHLGIGDRVHFVGAQRNPFRFMGKADVFVLPSLSEGMPNVLLEAMACGCPVVASDIAGGITREVLEEGKYGLIVPRADADALADALSTMLNDRVLRIEFSRRGLERAARSDVPGVISDDQELLSGTATSNDGRPGTPRDDAALAVTVSGQCVASDKAGSEASVPDAQPSAPRRSLASAIGRLLGGASSADAPASQAGATELAPADRGPTTLLVLVWMEDPGHIGLGTTTLLRSIDRSRYKVVLTGVFGEASTAGIDVPDDVAVAPMGLLLDADRAPDAKLAAALGPDNLGEYGVMVARARGLASVVAEVGADAILAQGILASTVATMAREYLPPNVATIATVRSYLGHPDDSTQGDPYRPLMERYLRRADGVIVPSEQLKAAVVDQRGVEERRVTMITEPIDVPEVSTTKEPLDLPGWPPAGFSLFVSVKDADSRMDVACLLGAVSYARERDDVRCVVVGDEGFREEVESFAARLGIADAVVYMGVDGHVDALLSRATGMVRSVVETEVPLSEAVTRAIMNGCALISPDAVDPAVRFLGDALGLRVRPGDPEALAEAMLQLAWDEDVRSELASRAAERLRSLFPAAVVARFGEVVDRAVASVSTPARKRRPRR